MGANENPVGTGPYQYLAHDQGRMVWEKRDGWWGTEALGLDAKPKYIVDIVNGSNNVALGLRPAGRPGPAQQLPARHRDPRRRRLWRQDLLRRRPYMMSANTAWLAVNNTIAAAGRPRLPQGAGLPPSTSTPSSTSSTRGIVAAGQPDRAAAPVGEVRGPGRGRRAGLQLRPRGGQGHAGRGWLCRRRRRRLARQQGRLAHRARDHRPQWLDRLDGVHRSSPSRPRPWASTSSRPSRTTAPARTPSTTATSTWPSSTTSSSAIRRGSTTSTSSGCPIQDVQTTENFGRYENEEAWALVQQLDQTPVDDVEGMKAITSQLQKIHLTDLPMIPLWYNGMWSQVSDAVWTNWPSADGNQYLPTTWRGYWQMGGIRMLDALRASRARRLSGPSSREPRPGLSRARLPHHPSLTEPSCASTSRASCSSTR